MANPRLAAVNQEAFIDKKRRTQKILNTLQKIYPEVKCALVYNNVFELLVATILSAQCTDKMVNSVTPKLFKKYRDVASLARAPIGAIERIIRPTGFFHHKAKNIKACAQAILEKHNSKVPDNLQDLVTLSGVGRKTANVVLGVGFNITTGIVVDTHVGRLARRLGLSAQNNPEKIERELMKLIAKNHWISSAFLFIEHGRRICKSLRPRCEDCQIRSLCQRNL